MSQYGTPSDTLEAAMKYDGDTLIVVGPEDFVEEVAPYFSNPEGEWWNSHRFSEQPFAFISDHLWSTPSADTAEQKFMEAFVELNGSKVKTFHYPGGKK